MAVHIIIIWHDKSPKGTNGNQKTARGLSSLHRWAPRYLSAHLTPASGAAPRRCCLRSGNWNCLILPRCRLSTYGCLAIHYAGPTIWNSLPDKHADSFDRFLKQFSLAANSVTRTLTVIYITRCAIYCLVTYLRKKTNKTNHPSATCYLSNSTKKLAHGNVLNPVLNINYLLWPMPSITIGPLVILRLITMT